MKHAAIAALVLAFFPDSSTSAAPPAPEAVAAAVASHFAALDGYRPGDLIRQLDFDQIVAGLKKSGADVYRFAPLRERIPADSSDLGRLNATKKGKSFLRKVARRPGGYAQVEALYREPRGKATVKDLVDARGGDVMIEYMTTTAGGKRLSKMLARQAREKPPKIPRIYTADQLLTEMTALSALPPRGLK